MHHFHLVAIVQRMLGMLAAWHDGAVHFHCHPALRQTLGRKQGGDGAAGRDLPALAVELNLHSANVGAAPAMASARGRCDAT